MSQRVSSKLIYTHPILIQKEHPHSTKKKVFISDTEKIGRQHTHPMQKQNAYCHRITVHRNYVGPNGSK